MNQQKQSFWSCRPQEFGSADAQDVQSADGCALTCLGEPIPEVWGSCGGVTCRSSGAADQQGYQRRDGFDLRLEELEDVEVPKKQ